MMNKQHIGRHLLDGLPIYDAREALVLHINDNDVAKADRKQPLDCVVARCLRREYHVEAVRIHLARTYVRGRNQKRWLKYETPPALASEIKIFDRGGAFEPGEYTLLPPRASHRFGARKNEKRRRKAFTGITRAKPRRVQNVRASAVAAF